MEDHYVRVHTPRGSHLVLATFGQAQAVVSRAGGLRVHRSWWVADKALVGIERGGRNLRLVLVNGLKVPVARSSVADVRARGWLQEEQ
jgi:DNA-binding LytR/AlgR family response regulator